MNKKNINENTIFIRFYNECKHDFDSMVFNHRMYSNELFFFLFSFYNKSVFSLKFIKNKKLHVRSGIVRSHEIFCFQPHILLLKDP